MDLWLKVKDVQVTVVGANKKEVQVTLEGDREEPRNWIEIPSGTDLANTVSESLEKGRSVEARLAPKRSGNSLSLVCDAIRIRSGR